MEATFPCPPTRGFGASHTPPHPCKSWRSSAMCTQGTYAAPMIQVNARAMPETMVDDSDPGIKYSGNWVRNPPGTSSDDFGGTVTFTSTSGSTATYVFQGESEKKGLERRD